jgi:hypothetical protein
MRTTGFELQARTAALLTSLERLAPVVGGAARGRKLALTMIKPCTEMDRGYRQTCDSRSPDEFIQRISAVARHAKRTKATLMLLTQLDYLPIGETREVICEARSLENIFLASRNTAKKHHRTRLAVRT